MPHPSGPNAYPSAPGNYPSAPDQWQTAVGGIVTATTVAARPSWLTATTLTTATTVGAVGVRAAPTTGAIVTATTVAATPAWPTAATVTTATTMAAAVGQSAVADVVTATTVAAAPWLTAGAAALALTATSVRAENVAEMFVAAALRTATTVAPTSSLVLHPTAAGLVTATSVAASQTVLARPGAASIVTATKVTPTSLAGGTTAAGLITATSVWVYAEYPYHPVFVRPAGPVRVQVPHPRKRLLVVETATGRKVAELAYTDLSWNSPLNGIGKCSATLPIEANLDSLSDQRIPTPRAALRAILSGPYRFSLVPCYGAAALMGGPMLPSSDVVGDRVTVGGAGMERMWEKRVLNRPTGTGTLTDPSRDVGAYATTMQYAIYMLAQEAMTTYGDLYPTRGLPITCAAVPPAVGEESFFWRSYDLVNVWKAVGELVARVDGPDVRLEPYLVEQPDGEYVYWDLQIGDPYLPASGNIGPDGPLPWTFAAANTQLTYTIDPSGMASSYFATGDGQDRAKKVARADVTDLTVLGFPALEEVDSATTATASLNTNDTQNRADALIAAHRTPTDTWSLQVPVDGAPDIGLVRRGDVARIEVRNQLYLEPGYHRRRITEISGGAGRTATLACDLDDDLLYA